MRTLKQQNGLRPRELRRRVILPARLRLGSQWTDICILNVSSRGLMIQSGQPARQGTIVEVRRERHIITGRVMWRDGGKIGLQCEDRVPVDDMLSLGAAKSLRLVAADGDLIERRQVPRRGRPESRLLGRTIQFAGVLAIVLALSISAVLWVKTTLAQPFRTAEAALNP